MTRIKVTAYYEASPEELDLGHPTGVSKNTRAEITEELLGLGYDEDIQIEVARESGDVTHPTRAEIATQVRRHCTPSSEAYAKGGDFLVAAVADWIENPPEWAISATEARQAETEPNNERAPEPRRFAIRRALEALVKTAEPELDFKLVNEIHVEPRVLTIHRFMTNAEALTPEEIEEEGVDPAARARFGMIASRAHRFSPILPKEES